MCLPLRGPSGLPQGGASNWRGADCHVAAPSLPCCIRSTLRVCSTGMWRSGGKRMRQGVAAEAGRLGPWARGPPAHQLHMTAGRAKGNWEEHKTSPLSSASQPSHASAARARHKTCNQAVTLPCTALPVTQHSNHGSRPYASGRTAGNRRYRGEFTFDLRMRAIPRPDGPSVAASPARPRPVVTSSRPSHVCRLLQGLPFQLTLQRTLWRT